MLLTFFIIVCICSLSNEEEDDNFGDNVWDDMVVAAALCQRFVFNYFLPLHFCFVSGRLVLSCFVVHSNDDFMFSIRRAPTVRSKLNHNNIFWFSDARIRLSCSGLSSVYDGMLKAEACRKILLLILIELCL